MKTSRKSSRKRVSRSKKSGKSNTNLSAILSKLGDATSITEMEKTLKLQVPRLSNENLKELTHFSTPKHTKKESNISSLLKSKEPFQEKLHEIEKITGQKIGRAKKSYLETLKSYLTGTVVLGILALSGWALIAYLSTIGSKHRRLQNAIENMNYWKDWIANQPKGISKLYWEHRNNAIKNYNYWLSQYEYA